MGWTHGASAVLASFLASLVEFVEALTIVLAVGVTRGWRSAITGALLGVALLTVLVAVFGTSLQVIPLRKLQLFVGLLLLVFGMRWLSKAILRASGVMSLRDETKVFARQTEALRLPGELRNIAIDGVGFITSFKAVVIEGTEVVFIVIAVGATGHMLLPASLGALAAGLLVILLGLVLHKPLARVPENALKFSVGVLLSAFGVFWIGEGLHLPWFGQDWVVVGLIICFGSTALGVVRIIKHRAAVQRGLSR
jgi:uncharacterized membrane protein